MGIVRLSAHTYRRLELISAACFFTFQRSEHTAEGKNEKKESCQNNDLDVFIWRKNKAGQTKLFPNAALRPENEEFEIFKFLLQLYKTLLKGDIKQWEEMYDELGFESLRSLEIFFEKFSTAYFIYSIMELMDAPQWHDKQKYEIAFLLVLKLFSRERELSAELCYSLSIFSQRLKQMISNPQDARCLKIYFDEYVELYHQLQLVPGKIAPDICEERRRNAISNTKQKKMYEKQKLWEQHSSKILEYKKKTRTIKKACEIYFHENADALSEYGIKSVRTLQNKLTGQKHPDRRRKERNEINPLLPIKKQDRNTLLNIINHNT